MNFFWKNCVTSPRAARLGTAVPKFIIDMVYVYDSYNDSYDESLYYSSYESSYESYRTQVNPRTNNVI